MFGRVLIAGCGLMGASFGLAVKSRGLAREIVGWDADPRALTVSWEIGAIDLTADNPEEAVSTADLVVLAAYVKSLPEILRRLVPLVSPGTIITDLGSVKGPLAAAAREMAAARALPPGAVFVAGHPMAGKSAQGAVHADANLFMNAVWILCPAEDLPGNHGDDGHDGISPSAARQALSRLSALIEAFGARPIVMSPERHDRAVAAVSHLPQAVASALMNTAADLDRLNAGVLGLAAAGFRDTTRIAASTPGMWRDICLDNREALLSALDRFEAEIASFRRSLEGGDAAAVEKFFTRAKTYKEGMQRES